MSESTFQELTGKTILIGLTCYSADNTFLGQEQYWGTVTEANERHILVRLPDGSTRSLPPDLSSTRIAPPGEYRLRSTGEIVVNPDYLTTWTVRKPEPEGKANP